LSAFSIRQSIKEASVELGHEARRAAQVALALGFVRGFIPGRPGISCPLRALTGLPCPLCGMTTSLTELSHLHLIKGVIANPAGVLVVLIALIATRRRMVPFPVVLATLAAMWAWEIIRVSAHLGGVP
jgi:hypothetical protein